MANSFHVLNWQLDDFSFIHIVTLSRKEKRNLFWPSFVAIFHKSDVTWWKNMLPTFYCDRVFESFLIDVCFVRGWTAQDLTMDNTSPLFLPMDQAWIFDQTNASTQLDFTKQILSFIWTLLVDFTQKITQSLSLPIFVFFLPYSCKRNPFSFFFDKKNIQSMKSLIYLYKL